MIKLSKLKKGMTLLLGTTDFAYEMKVQNSRKCVVELTGGIFTKPQRMTLVGSHVKTGEITTLQKNEIHKGGFIELCYDKQCLILNEVETAKLTSKDKKWNLEVFGDMDISDAVKGSKNKK